MDTIYQNNPNPGIETVWGGLWQEQGIGIPAQLRPWLIDPASMTRHLRRCYQEKFNVQVLSQCWGSLRTEDARFLKRETATSVLIRDVHLCCDLQPLVFARSLFPVSLFENRGRCLNALLDNRPLGDFLFRTPGVHRSDFQFARLYRSQFNYQLATARHAVHDEFLWARRSFFNIDNHRIFLMEVFFPQGVYS